MAKAQKNGKAKANGKAAAQTTPSVKAQTTPSVKDLLARLEAIGFVLKDERGFAVSVTTHDRSYGLALCKDRTCTAKIAEAALKNVGILIIKKEERQWQIGVAKGEKKYWDGHLCVTKDAMCSAVRLWRKTIK